MNGGFGEAIGRVFAKHRHNVAGVCVSIIKNHESFDIEDYAFGHADSGGLDSELEEADAAADADSGSPSGKMRTTHFMQCASLSKTVCAAFSIEYFAKRGVDMASTSVNAMLAEANAEWRIEGKSTEFRGDDVTLNMLLNHTALGMHYVYGIPITSAMPSPVELLDGSCDEAYGYKKLLLERKPGESFAYSGGGFVVMQYLIESLEGNAPISEITRDFLDKVGLDEFTFSQRSDSHFDADYAVGFIVPLSQPVLPALAFPPFAAGGLCTAHALSKFLCHLSIAYHSIDGSGAISHRTALLMLGGNSDTDKDTDTDTDSKNGLQDRGAMAFMGAKIGLGVFVAAAGPRNRFMLHQAANDGFRGVYLHCFAGPDAGKGAVVLCNGDNPAVMLQCELLQVLLGCGALDISEGIQHELFSAVAGRGLDLAGVKQEAIVNKGLLDLVMFAFVSPDDWLAETKGTKVKNTGQAAVRARL